MSNQYLKLRRSSVPGKTPETGSIDFGEIALNTYDGLAFMKKSGSNGEEIVTLGAGGGGGNINTGSFATTGSNTFTGLQIITGSNGVLRYSGTDANTGNPGYPSLAEIHANDANPWLERFYNDTYSTSDAVMAYFGWDDGRFVFHNESTQSIGLQVNGYNGDNGLLVYEDKVAFVNNIEVAGTVNTSGSIYINSGSLILPYGAIIRETDVNALTFGSGSGVSQQDGAIAIGTYTGIAQRYDAIAIGASAGGGTFQGQEAIAIGLAAGQEDQGDYAIAIGSGAGQSDQGIYSIAIGTFAGGGTPNALKANFIGYYAGNNASGAYNSNFIGVNAGQNATYADKSNFIGHRAGESATNAFRSNFIGRYSGFQATEATYSNFLGNNAGYQATNADNSNFLGSGAGFQAASASRSNFLGWQAGYQSTAANNSNFIGALAGALTNANDSNFIGRSAGFQATNANSSNFLGIGVGYGATNANNSNFLGNNAGFQATNASYSTLIGYKVGLTFSGNNIGSNNIIIGNNISLPDAIANAINLGGVIFATDTYSDVNGDPSIAPVNGKVGINVVTPNYNLEVSGTVAFSSLPITTQTNVVGIDTTTGQLTTQQITFLKSRTKADATSSLQDYDSIFNPANLLVQDTSVFYVDLTSYYYVLGDLSNSGSIVADGTIKVGGILYNSGSITGTGSII